VRIAVVLPERDEARTAALAEEHAVFGVVAGYHEPLTSMNAAIYAALATTAVRVVVRVLLGSEHPVTIAEEIAVFDNICGGRTIVLADAGALTDGDASAEIEILQSSLSARPVRLEGKWFPPSDDPALSVLAVTPQPAQVTVPVWLTGAAAAVAAAVGAPALASQRSSHPGGRVQPALMEACGDPAADRDEAIAWEQWGASHLVVQPAQGADLSESLSAISSVIAPEVAMPYFPRVMTDVPPPAEWPGAGAAR